MSSSPSCFPVAAEREADVSIYLNFYGLDRDPFGVTPDPEFLFMTPGHREALAQLLYGIQERKGFMLVTAEVGMARPRCSKRSGRSSIAPPRWRTCRTPCCPSKGS